MTKIASYSTGRHDRAATKQTQESCCHSSRLGRSFSVSRSPRRYAKSFRHGKNTAKALSEMRNRIYECYLVSSSNSLSLTHVCTQIRSEFRPLYLGDIYHVSISKVDRLVQAFFPLMQELKAPITLAINIKRGRGTNPVQFLPFLRSVVSRKQIKVQFYCKGPGESLARFLNTALGKRRQQWKALTEAHVSDINLRPHEDAFTICFTDGGFEKSTTGRGITGQRFCADFGFKQQRQVRMLELLSEIDGPLTTRRHWEIIHGKCRARITL